MDARNEMELPEEEIRRFYPQALSLLTGFEHAPRLGHSVVEAQADLSAGIAAPSRFRPTTPGLLGRGTGRADGVNLLERIENAGGDELLTPAAATLARVLRRAVAIAMAVAEDVAARSGGGELKRINLETRLARRSASRICRASGRRIACRAVGSGQCHGVSSGRT